MLRTRIRALLASFAVLWLSSCQPDHDPFIGVTLSSQGTIVLVFSRCDYGPLVSQELARERGAVDSSDDEIIWRSDAVTSSLKTDTNVQVADLKPGRYYVSATAERGFDDDEAIEISKLVPGTVLLNHRKRPLNEIHRERVSCKDRQIAPQRDGVASGFTVAAVETGRHPSRGS